MILVHEGPFPSDTVTRSIGTATQLFDDPIRAPSKVLIATVLYSLLLSFQFLCPGLFSSDFLVQTPCRRGSMKVALACGMGLGVAKRLEDSEL